MKIYSIINKSTNKIYIGATKQKGNLRFIDHRKLLKNGKHPNLELLKDYNNHGLEDFEFNVIHKNIKTVKELEELEQYYIDLYDTYTNGYNYTLGGKGSYGKYHSEETRKTMHQDKKLKYLGSGNPFYGKKHTEKTKEKFRNRDYSFNKKEIINVTTGEIFKSVKEAGIKYNIAPTHISRVLSGKRKTTHGYVFKYNNQDNTVPSLDNN